MERLFSEYNRINEEIGEEYNRINEEIGEDGMNAIQRRERAIRDLGGLGCYCLKAGKLMGNELLLDEDLPFILRLLILIPDPNVRPVSAIFSPSAITRKVETQDKNGITHHHSYEAFLNYIKEEYF